MRSTQDLLAELNEESTKHWVVMMVVAFEKSTIFVEPGAQLQLLNEAVLTGGHPIGLIAVDKAQNQLTIRTETYPENTGMEEQCETLLRTLTSTLEASLRAR